MSELQPKIKDTAILTEGQVRDIFKGGAINNPDFLKELYIDVNTGVIIY